MEYLLVAIKTVRKVDRHGNTMSKKSALVDAKPSIPIVISPANPFNAFAHLLGLCKKSFQKSSVKNAGLNIRVFGAICGPVSKQPKVMFVAKGFVPRRLSANFAYATHAAHQ